MTISNKEAFESWTAIVDAINRARAANAIPDECEEIADTLQRLASDELTALENQALKESEGAYRVLADRLRQEREKLEKAKEDADQFIKQAGEAAKVIAFLAKIIPLLA